MLARTGRIGPVAALDVRTPGPVLRYLPTRLWLIGLGHLGQAYLFALGLLPYERPSDLHLLLQDDDIVTPSTESTSILTDAAIIGKKTCIANGGIYIEASHPKSVETCW